MNHGDPMIRRVASEAAIGLGAIVGAYLLVVEPQEARLAEAHGAAAALHHAIVSAPEDTQAARAALVQSEQAMAEIERRSALARDEASVFAGIMALAAATGVSVDSIQPAPPRVLPARPAADAGVLAASTPTDRRLAFNLTLSGEFADAARFLRAMALELGYTTVRSVRVEPLASEAGRQRVSLVVVTEHTSLQLPRHAAVAPKEAP